MGKITDELMCPVYKHICDDPAMTSCGHIFCAECIHGALSVRRHCPVCRQTDPGVSKPHFLRRIVENVVHRCPVPGCGIAISATRRSLEEHEALHVAVVGVSAASVGSATVCNEK